MIKRFPATVPTRSRTVATETLVFTVGVAKDKVPSVYEQTKQALARIDGSLVEAGSEVGKILTAIVYLADIGQKEEMNRAWDEWVDRESPPMRVCVSGGLEGKDLVEIVVTAAK